MDETEREQLNRNLSELLNELRVAIPGVQVLFAFLLGVPFTQRFTRLAAYQKDIYFGTLVCAAAATALLIAPSAYHRIEFRLGDKRHIVAIANWFAIVGLGFLALAMTGVVLLVTDFIFGTIVTMVATSLTALLFALLWYLLPLRRRRRILAQGK